MSAGTSKTPEELDAEERREVESKLKEVLDLMTARHHRDRADETLTLARERREASVGDRRPIYHRTESGHHAATTMQTKAALDLAEQIKLRIQLGQYARELDETLERLSERYLAVLERQLGRSRY
jgi:hypothetical protein